MEGFPPNFAQL